MSDVRRSESAWFTEWTPESIPEDDAAPSFDPPPPTPPRRRRSRSPLKWVIALTMVAVLGAAGWVGYSLYRSFGNVFGGNIISAIWGPGTPLSVDQFGNTNVLLLGRPRTIPAAAGRC